MIFQAGRIYLFFFFFFWFTKEKKTHWGWSNLPPPGHWGGSQPPPMAESFIYLFFGFARDKNGHQGWPDLFPLGRWGSRGHPQWPDLSFSSSSLFFFFFFFSSSPEKSLERAVGGGVWVVSHLFGWLISIGCFDFILNLYIFLKMLRRQLIIGRQKTPHFCHDRIATALQKDI